MSDTLRAIQAFPRKSDTPTVVQAIHQRSDTVAAVQAFRETVNKVVSKAIQDGTHNSDRVLLILTETDPNSGYGYEKNDSSYPHSNDGRLIMPFGKNEQGQRQFLISFDPRSCGDRTHPDPSVSPGWDWAIYESEQIKQPELEQAEPQIMIALELEKIDPTLLIRIGNWSLRPIDIKWIDWNFKSPVDGELVTAGALSDGSRILFKTSEPTYMQDLETLEYVTNSANWKPKADWLVNQEDKLAKQNR